MAPYELQRGPGRRPRADTEPELSVVIWLLVVIGSMIALMFLAALAWTDDASAPRHVISHASPCAVASSPRNLQEARARALAGRNGWRTAGASITIDNP